MPSQGHLQSSGRVLGALVLTRASLPFPRVPSQLASRIWSCKQDELASRYKFDPATLPPLLGGTCTAPTYEDWARGQLAARELSKQKVTVG